MKFFFTVFAVFFLTGYARSQYYYNDVVVLKETNRQYQAIKTAHISSITAQSFESDGQPTQGFLLKQDVSGSQITTSSNVASATESVSVNTYANNRLAKTVDNSTNVISTVNYAYDAAGNVQNIATVITDTFMNSNSEEVHQWFYSNNMPTYMLRIKDKTDTTLVEFVKDEQGNIAEEHWKKKGRKVENYFYYYNSAHLITDIVRFNLKAGKLLPDFLFEYDAAGRISQFIQVPQNSGGYLTWHYEYNSNALRQKETCFDRQKRLVGSIEYMYR